MITSQQIIEQTKKWISEVVVGCNFCPFAAATVKQDKVYYVVEPAVSSSVCIDSFLQEMRRLDNDQSVETSFLFFPNSFEVFADYLDMVSLAEKLVKQKQFEGIYQLASFHPQYLFAGSDDKDAANYTNRSPYPMLHLLREESIDKALLHYNNPEKIPERNIHFAREKGLLYMKMLRDACL